MGGARRRALWAVASVVAVAGASACGAAPTQLARPVMLPAPIPAAAPAEETTIPPAPDTPAPSPVAVRATGTRVPAPRLVVARVQAAPRPRPADDSLFGIEIPRLGLSTKAHDGQSLAVLGRGPGHLPGSAMPGERGNVVVPGHRTLSPHPFLDIDRLQNGDEIVLASAGARSVYLVTGTAIVSPDDTSVTDPTPNATLTLYACHPKGSDSQRYVVFARLKGPAGDPPSPSQRRPNPPPDDATPPPPPPSCGLIRCVRR